MLKATLTLDDGTVTFVYQCERCTGWFTADHLHNDLCDRCEPQVRPAFKRLSPQQGGCWYCGMEGDWLYMCREFDTLVHPVCVARALKHNPDDEEAQIIAQDIGITVEL